MKRPTLEEQYVTAWRVIAPAAEPPQVVVKKWPHGRVHQITTPGAGTIFLLGDQFIKRLRALTDAARTIEQQIPKPSLSHGVEVHSGKTYSN